MNSQLTVATIAALFLLISGCSTKKNQTLPQDGPTTEEVYANQLEQASHSKFRPYRPINAQEHNLSLHAEHDAKYITDRFPMLPNPTLVGFRKDHLSGKGGHPVKGYTSAFKMYETDKFALPGEVINPLRDL